MSSLPAILARLDPQFQLAFEARRPNRTEAAARARDVDAYLERAAALALDGYDEEALSRHEDAQIAAARSLEALFGARLRSSARTAGHVARKHFLVAALQANGLPAPSIESLVAVTRLRNLVTYDLTAAAPLLDARALDDALQVSGTVRRGLRAVLERHDPSRLPPNAERAP